MPLLSELQAQFAAALADAGQARSAAALFHGSAGPALARLAIYRGNVLGNCIKALQSAYPIVAKIVGAEFFDALARAYARAGRSGSADLNRYGAGFAEFLEQFAPVADLPYLPDVARMEWQAHRAYFARDPLPFDPASLRLRLAAPCAILESPWPLARLWTVHQDDYRGSFDVDLDSGPERVLIHRPRWRAEVVALAGGDFHFLQSIQQGASLGAALEAGASHADFDPSTILPRWIAARVLESVV
jgi:hypothetical protein